LDPNLLAYWLIFR